VRGALLRLLAALVRVDAVRDRVLARLRRDARIPELPEVP
jgi:hypothetical protein